MFEFSKRVIDLAIFSDNKFLFEWVPRNFEAVFNVLTKFHGPATNGSAPNKQFPRFFSQQMALLEPAYALSETVIVLACSNHW